jgi:hypothetical protein
MNLAFLRCHSCGSNFVKVDAPFGQDAKAVICQSCGCMAEGDSWPEVEDNWVLQMYTLQPLPEERRIPEEELQRRYGRKVPSLEDVLNVAKRPEKVAQASFDFGGES